MKKINNTAVAVLIFCFCAPLWPAWAQEAESLFNKKELEEMIAAASAAGQVSTYTEWNERNPFDTTAIEALPSAASKVPKELTDKDFLVQGVFLGSARPSAIINHTVVGIGDKIKTAIVTSISQDTITLQDDKGKEIILHRIK